MGTKGSVVGGVRRPRRGRLGVEGLESRRLLAVAYNTFPTGIGANGLEQLTPGPAGDGLG